MNNKKSFFHIVLALMIIVLALLLIDPFMYWMPNSLVPIVVIGLVVLSGLFFGLIWREKSLDEREAQLSAKAGRIGYLTGLSILLIGIVVDFLVGTRDVWLISAFVTMIVVKILTVAYTDRV